MCKICDVRIADFEICSEFLSSVSGRREAAIPLPPLPLPLLMMMMLDRKVSRDFPLNLVDFCESLFLFERAPMYLLRFSKFREAF